LQGPLLEVTGRGVWGMALICIPWAVDIMCGIAVACAKPSVGKACVDAQGSALDVA